MNLSYRQFCEIETQLGILFIRPFDLNETVESRDEQIRAYLESNQLDWDQYLHQMIRWESN